MVLAEIQFSESVLALKQVALFLGVLVRLMLGRRELYETRGNMPLDDDRVFEPRSPSRQPGETS